MSDFFRIAPIGLGLPILGAAASAASGALSGSVGAAIMRDAGHDGYSPLTGAQSGAVGGAVLFLPVGIAIGALAKPLRAQTDEAQSSRPWLLHAGANIAASAAYTATGAAILRSAGHTNVMDVYHASRAGLVGSATIFAAGLALGVIVTVTFAACGLSYIVSRERAENTPA